MAEIPAAEPEEVSFKSELTLMLDGISDPGNLGTIIRTADWFGVKNIICSEESTDAFSPKAVQSAMGSLFRVNVFYEVLPRFLKNILIHHIPVYGTLLEGKNIYSEKLSANGIILIGSESHGISEELIPFITNKITVPSFPVVENKKADSLNAAMATAIVCSEFRRKMAD